MKLLALIPSVALVSALGCSGGGGEDVESAQDYGDGTWSQDEAFSSDVATLLDFTFSGTVITSAGSTSTARTTAINAQLFYLVGQLNARTGVAMLNKAVISNVTYTSSGGLYTIRYSVSIPVAWGRKTSLPTTLALKLPRRVDSTGISAFHSKYAATCHDSYPLSAVLTSNFWYHYRPAATGCSIDTVTDAVDATATIATSALNTYSKLPEYHKAWEDGVLKAVAIFGKYESGATASSDAGITAWNAFISAFRTAYPSAATTPEAIPGGPNASINDVTFKVTLANGKKFELVALLVDELKSEGSTFKNRYAELSPDADLIMYNGHAGLGSNTSALSNLGNFFPKKWQLFFYNGCDTSAYQDTTLATRRAALNADDASGTKYMDMVTNAMPAFFDYMDNAALAMISAFTATTPTKTYNQIFSGISTTQVVNVTGEEDNAYSASSPPAAVWQGVNESGSVGYKEMKSYETAVLPAGKYIFTLAPNTTSVGGDADLRVRVGAAPDTTQTHKCKSYVYNSNELCEITVATASKVYMTVTGDKRSVSSAYVMKAFGVK